MTETCWLWQAAKSSAGYGLMWWEGKLEYVHRVAYTQFIGFIEKGLDIDHLCRIPACVNPDHLEAVTHQENIKRGNAGMWGKSKTHCPSGHPYQGSNLVIDNKGGRRCRSCHNTVNRKYKLRKQLAL